MSSPGESERPMTIRIAPGSLNARLSSIVVSIPPSSSSRESIFEEGETEESEGDREESAVPPSPTAVSTDGSYIECPTCTFHNDIDNVLCLVCSENIEYCRIVSDKVLADSELKLEELISRKPSANDESVRDDAEIASHEGSVDDAVGEEMFIEPNSRDLFLPEIGVASPRSRTSESESVCPNCTFRNEPNSWVCSVCEYHFPGVDESKIVCPMCTWRNEAQSSLCGVCKFLLTPSETPSHDDIPTEVYFKDVRQNCVEQLEDQVRGMVGASLLEWDWLSTVGVAVALLKNESAADLLSSGSRVSPHIPLFVHPKAVNMEALLSTVRKFCHGGTLTFDAESKDHPVAVQKLVFSDVRDFCSVSEAKMVNVDGQVFNFYPYVGLFYLEDVQPNLTLDDVTVAFNRFMEEREKYGMHIILSIELTPYGSAILHIGSHFDALDTLSLRSQSINFGRHESRFVEAILFKLLLRPGVGCNLSELSVRQALPLACGVVLKGSKLAIIEYQTADAMAQALQDPKVIVNGIKCKLLAFDKNVIKEVTYAFNDDYYNTLLTAVDCPNVAAYHLNDAVFGYVWEPKVYRAKLKALSLNEGKQTESLKRIRTAVMLATRGACCRQKYVLEGQEIKLNVKEIRTEVFTNRSRLELPANFGFKSHTNICVLRGDNLQTIKNQLAQSNRPLLISGANRFKPGGGYREGEAGQEEDLWRRTNIYRFLDTLDEEPSVNFPIDSFGAVLCTGVTVFRGQEDQGYEFYNNEEEGVFYVDVLCAPMLSNPTLVDGHFSETDVLVMQRKIHALFLIAIARGYDSLVLPAFGCDPPWENPVSDVARILKQCIHEYYGCFAEIHIVVNHAEQRDIFKQECHTKFERKMNTTLPALQERFKDPLHAHQPNSVVAPVHVCSFSKCEELQDSIHRLCFWHPVECPQGKKCALLSDLQHSQRFLHLGEGNTWTCVCNQENSNALQNCGKCKAPRLARLNSRKPKALDIPTHWNLASGELKVGQTWQKVDVTQQFKPWIQSILDTTCIAKHIGIGRDSHHVKHDGFRVEKIERVENPHLWMRYQLEVDKVTQLLSQKKPGLPVVKVANYHPKLWETLQVNHEVRERLLFHGTKPKHLEAILGGGLDERYSNPDGLFGRGIYFAENSSKADEYITPDADGNLFMFLARALLGSPCVTTTKMKQRSVAPDNPLLNVPFDSVLAECQATYKTAEDISIRNGPPPELIRYREFIIYARERCYPELLITFKRIDRGV